MHVMYRQINYTILFYLEICQRWIVVFNARVHSYFECLIHANIIKPISSWSLLWCHCAGSSFHIAVIWFQHVDFCFHLGLRISLKHTTAQVFADNLFLRCFFNTYSSQWIQPICCLFYLRLYMLCSQPGKKNMRIYSMCIKGPQLNIQATSVMMFASDSILKRRLYKHVSAGFLSVTVLGFWNVWSEDWNKHVNTQKPYFKP